MPRERHVLQALFISWSFHFKFHIQTWFNTLLFTLGLRYVICDHCAEFLFLLAFCKLPHSFRCITTTLWTRVKPRRMQTDLGSGQLEAQILYVDEYQITSGFHLDMKHLTSVNGASFLYHSTHTHTAQVMVSFQSEWYGYRIGDWYQQIPLTELS